MTLPGPDRRAEDTPPARHLTASGPGSVVIEGDNTAPVTTNVTVNYEARPLLTDIRPSDEALRALFSELM